MGYHLATVDDVRSFRPATKYLRVTRKTHGGPIFCWILSSKYTDNETGLYYYGYRFHMPDVGRWFSWDPMGENGGGPNILGFVGNDPVNQADVLGLLWGPRVIVVPVPGAPIFVPCAIVEAIARSFLASAEDQRAWDRFISGSRANIVLSEAEVESVLASSSVAYQRHMDNLRTRCVTLSLNWGVSSGLQVDSVGVSVGDPWRYSIGRTTMKIRSGCACRCLGWFAEVNDLYNFDPAGIPGFSGRTWGGESMTILVRLAQISGNCGWAEFSHVGVSSAHFEGPGCTSRRPRYWP